MAGWLVFGQSPLCVLVYRLLYLGLLRKEDTEGILNFYVVFQIIFLVMLVAFIILRMLDEIKSKELILVCCILSSGFISAVERGNSVQWAFAFSLLFVYLYRSEKGWVRQIGILCLAIAANIKYYPCLFGLLLLKNKRWRDSVIALAEGVGLWLFPWLISKILIRIPLIAKTGAFVEEGNIISVSSSNISSCKGFVTGEGYVDLSISFKPIIDRLLQSSSIGWMKDDWLSMGIFILVVVLGLVAIFISKNNYIAIALISILCIMIPTVSLWYHTIFLLITLLVLLKEKVTWHSASCFCLLLCSIVMVYKPKILTFMAPQNTWHIVILYFGCIVYAFLTFFGRRKQNAQSMTSEF